MQSPKEDNDESLLGKDEDLEISDDSQDEDLSQEILLARLYDDLVRIDNAEISIVELEGGETAVVIILRNTKYSEDSGFEKIEGVGNS